MSFIFIQPEFCAELYQHIQECDNCRVVINTLRKTIELCRQTNTPAELPDNLRERLFFKLHQED
jgi:predicted anti-sigma-YlaC factor YlaD